MAGDKWMTSGRQRLKQGLRNHCLASRRPPQARAPMTRQPHITATATAPSSRKPSAHRQVGLASGTGGYSAYADPVVRRGVVVSLRHSEGTSDSSDAQPQHPEHPSRTRRRIRDASNRHYALISHYNPQYRPRTEGGIQQQPHPLVRRIQPQQSQRQALAIPYESQYGPPISQKSRIPLAPSSASQVRSNHRLFEYAPPELNYRYAQAQERQLPSVYGSREDENYYETMERQQYRAETTSKYGDWHNRSERSDGDIPHFQRGVDAVAQIEVCNMLSSDDMFRPPSMEPQQTPHFPHPQPPPFAPLALYEQQMRQRSGSFMDEVDLSRSCFESIPSVATRDSRYVQEHGILERSQHHPPNSQAGLHLPSRERYPQSLTLNGHDDFLSHEAYPRFDSEPPPGSLGCERHESGIKPHQPPFAKRRRGSVEITAQPNASVPFQAKNDCSDDHRPTQPPVFSSFRDQFFKPNFHLPCSGPDFTASRRPHSSHPRLEHRDNTALAPSRPPPFSPDRSAMPREPTLPMDYSGARRVHGLDGKLAMKAVGAGSTKARRSDDGNNQKLQESLHLQAQTRPPSTSAKKDQSSRPDSSHPDAAAAGPNAFGDFIDATDASAAVVETVHQRKRKDRDERHVHQTQKPLVKNALFYAEINSSKKRKDAFHTKCARPVLGTSTDICFFNEERKVDWYNRPLTSPVVLPPKVSLHSDTQRHALHDVFSGGGLDGSDDDDMDLSGEKFLWR